MNKKDIDLIFIVYILSMVAFFLMGIIFGEMIHHLHTYGIAK